MRCCSGEQGGELRENAGTDRPESRTVAIVQSNYVPWKGYFDLIRSVDEFILYDEVQYTRRDWRNRNRIKTPVGIQWLTIPVEVSGRYHQAISETRIADASWAKRHWKTLTQSYGRAPGFPEFSPMLEGFYSTTATDQLSVVNEALLRIVCGALGIQTKFRQSSAFSLDVDDPTERLVSICRQACATTYLSGPAARSYLDEARFHDAGIDVAWMSYEGYPEYSQLHGPFDHRVSVLDLLFNTGARAIEYLLPPR